MLCAQIPRLYGLAVLTVRLPKTGVRHQPKPLVYLDALVPRNGERVKLLLAVGRRLGYPPFDVGSVVRQPKLKDTLAERILT